MNATTITVVTAVIAPLLMAVLRRRRRAAPKAAGTRSVPNTSGGDALVVATSVGALLAGTEAATRGVVVAAVLLFASHAQSQRSGVPRLARVGRLTAALAVPLLGVRAETTGVAAFDVIVTAVIVFVVAESFAALGGSAGVGGFVGLVTAGAVAALALAYDQPHLAAVAAALLGSSAGVLFFLFPPSSTTMGPSAGAFVGIVVAVTTIAIDQPIAGPSGLVAPVVLVLLPVTGAAWCTLAHQRHRLVGPTEVPHIARRLLARRWSPLTVLTVIGGAQFTLVALAYLVGTKRVGALPGTIAGAGTALGVLAAAMTASVYASRPEGFTLSARVTLLAGAAVGALFVVPSGIAALQARSHLETARGRAIVALDAAHKGDVKKARAEFTAAGEEFQLAQNAFGSPLVNLGRMVPVLGLNVDAVRTVTDIGLALSSKADQVAAKADADDLQVVDGRLPIDKTKRISIDLHDALLLLDDSTGRLDDVASGFLAGPVRDAVDTLRTRVEEAHRDVAVVSDAARAAATLFGGDGPRRYFLAVVTPTELRGSGGLIGIYGEMVAQDGKLSLPFITTIESLNRKTDPVRQRALLPAVYGKQYEGFFPEKFWHNLSAPADFPTVATAIESAYPATAGGGPIDGVLSIDPIGLRSLLKVTGPVRVASWPVAIDSTNADDILLYEQYVQLEGDTRDAFLKDVARAVFDKLTSGALPPPSKIAAAMVDAVAEGHLRLHSVRPDEQSFFTEISASGELPAVDGDSVTLVTQNGSQSKIDYFLHRSLSYDAVADRASGTLSATATIELRNDAPADGLPAYIIGGPPTGITEPGHSRIYVSLYTPLALTSTTLDAQTIGAATAEESGRFMHTVLIDIPSHTTVRVRMELRGRLASGDYRLAIGRQPTIYPDHVDVTVKNPDGSALLIDGSGLRWSADLTVPQQLLALQPASD